MLYESIKPSGIVDPDILFKIVSVFGENRVKIKKKILNHNDDDFVSNFSIFKNG